MSRTTRNTLVALLGGGLILAAFWFASRGTGPSGPPGAQPPDTTAVAAEFSRPGTVDSSFFEADVVDRDAIAALERMGAYLRTLTAFQVIGSSSREEVLPDGQKIQRDMTADLLVRRPNRLRAEITNDLRHRFLFYDGESFTVYADRPNYYATAPAPGTIAELVDSLHSRFGIEVPLEDLFHWGTSRADLKAITTARVIGPSKVDGTSTDHYAYRQDGIDWQLWIQQGDHPLPRKLVITTLTDEARPQHTSVLSWNLAPSYSDAAFVFEPPRGANRIRIAESSGGKQ